MAKIVKIWYPVDTFAAKTIELSVLRFSDFPGHTVGIAQM